MGLREFIILLEKNGSLVRIHEEIDWKYEIGKMTRQSRIPLMFENIKDYADKKVFTNGVREYSSIALCLGLEHGTTLDETLKIMKKRISNPLLPEIIENGPVHENICKSGEIDLYNLPVPWWNEKDGGRYIGTWHLNVTKDSETGMRNIGVYRMQMMSRNQTTVSVYPGSHLYFHMKKAERNGQPLEMAVAIGVSETLVMSAGAAAPYGTDEYTIAGGLEQKPVELVKCRTVNLEVPADSEYVIEGIIKPGIRVKDGPYLNYAGRPNINLQALLFEVTAVTFRNNPIFRGTSIGIPGAEDHMLLSVLSRFNMVDFHGKRSKQKVQNFLLRNRYFRAFQLSGSLGYYLRKILLKRN